MGKLVQDESGQIFADEGGGVLTPLTAEQADAYARGDNPLKGAAMAANTGLVNVASGLLSLFDQDYEQVNQESRQKSEALNLANPITSTAAQYLPQAVIGAASSGAGVLPAAGAEAIMGAGTTPETPIQGALLGGALGAAGELAGPALGYLANKGRGAASQFGIGRAASLPDEALPPGVPRPGTAAGADDLEQVAVQGGAGAPPSPVSPSGTYTDLADDMSAPGAMRPLQAPASDAVGDLPLQRPERMADRVLGSIEREAAANAPAPVRVAGDLMTPDELAQYGIPLNRGQAEYLSATTAQPGAANRARAMMADEEARRSSPAMGRVINENIAMQQEAGTNFINAQLDVPQGAALTDGTVSTVMANIGNRMDAIAEEMGGVPITKDIRDEVAEVMRLSAGRHTRTLQETIDNALKKADNNGGMLDGQAWQTMRTDLTKQITKGMRDGKIDWVNEVSDVMDTFTRAMESKLPTESQRELRKLRKQYAIGATLSKPGTRNADGLVNPTSFYSNWKRPQSLKQRGHDDVGRFMNTINFLTQKRVPDSGTATRIGRMAEGGLESVPVVGGIYKGLMTP